MRITPFGAAGGVTGSCYYLTTKKAKILVDCGIFQGTSITEAQNRVSPSIDVVGLHSIILTHAHLDHCGRLPLFVKAGFCGPIFATPSTIEVAKLILLDAAHIQETDTLRANRRRARALRKMRDPLFTTEDVQRVFPLFQPVAYEELTVAGTGIKFKFVDAGHLLGSASVEIFVNDAGVRKSVLFSGDLGNYDSPIMRDPAKISDCDFDMVFVESTYGDRDHRTLEATVHEFLELIRNAIKRSGKVMIPTFSVGRAQQILFHLGEFFAAKKIPRVPVYLDSPMAIKASRLYKKYFTTIDERFCDPKVQKMLKLGLRSLKICETGEESRALNDKPGPFIVLAGAGMCNGGRILHHFRHGLCKPENTVIICGYQAEGSLGRMLVEGKKRVRIYGEDVGVAATVCNLGGFSAHGGQSELLRWLQPICQRSRGHRPRVVVIHGENKQREALAEQIHVRFGIRPVLPFLGEAILL
ncbi:MAG: MBL fold metallo-hydrolase [Opitutales bacterium]|nr:MBL fold metallo-hydrolase [Opitutales bacterium]